MRKHRPQPTHYFDANFGRDVVKIKPGEFYATTRPCIIATVLGSCVSACVRDPIRGFAGMNHFMLPRRESVAPTNSLVDEGLRYGAYAMELLLDEFVLHGSYRRDLEVKVFGGASVMTFAHGDVGKLNAAFVLEYLAAESIVAAAADLGGPYPRKILQFVDTGKVLVKYLSRLTNDKIDKREAEYAGELLADPAGDDLNLYG